MENCLKFGDLIILQYNSKQNIVDTRYQQSTSDIREKQEGFLSATGFIDTNIYFQEVKSFEKARDTFSNATKNIPNLVNYRDFVFQICPKLNYEFHKEYQKSIKFYKKLQKIKNLTRKQKQLKTNLAMKLSKLSERIQKEKEQNILIQEDHESKHITYGSEVFLMHHDSESYINAKNDSAQTNKIGYDCYLSDWYSRAMIFKIQPKYKSRQDGEVIQYGDNVIFQNVKYNTYLSFTDDLKAEHDKYIEFSEDNVFRMNQNVIDPLAERFRAYLSQETETAWQINLFRNLSKTNHIKGCDMIRLKHTELNGHLSANLDYTDKTDVFVRHYDGEFEEEEFSIHSIWEIGRNDLEKRGERFERLEKNEHEKKKARDGNDKIPITFRLKHFCSGKLMASTDDNVCYLKKNPKDLQEESDYVILQSQPILKNLDFLQPEFSYYMMNNSNLYLAHDKDNSLRRSKIIEKFQGHEDQVSKIYTPLHDKDYETERNSLIFQEKFSSEDAFTIKRISKSIQNEILFVRSALPKLKNITYIFKTGNKGQLNSELYLQIEEIFKEICFFLYDIDSKTEIDIFQQEDDPITRRQKILKDMKFIDIFIDVIYLPFKSKMFQLNKITQQDMITHMLSKCYSTLRFTIQEYRPNELYCSQWLNLIMDQCLKTRKYNDIQAGVTFQELIDNNKRILESRIETSTMEKFITFLMKQNKLSNYVEIIRAICICNDSPMIKNQKELSKMILEDEEVRENLIFKLKINDENEVMIRPMMMGKFDWMLLQDFRKNSIKQESGKTYYYFISMTLLLSDLCMEKNYLAIDKLRHLYPFNISFKIFSDDNFPPELREAFCKILENLWINIHPFNAIKIPQHILIYEKISTNIEVCSTGENVDTYVRTKEFVALHLKDCFKPTSYRDRYSVELNLNAEDFNQIEDSEESKKDITLRFNKFNYAVLSLCEKMFELGFYNSVGELNIIIDRLKKNLNQFLINKIDMMKNKNKSSGFENRDTREEEDTMVINCKKKICRILLIILDIKSDYLIKQFIANLKSLNVVTRKGKTLIEDSSKQKLIEKNPSTTDIDVVIDNFKIQKNTIQNLLKDLNSKKDINLNKDSEFISYMLELINSKNEGLKKLSLKILNKLYSQKKELGDNLCNILVILNKKDENIWKSVLNKSRELRTLCENCELWYSNKKTVEYEKVEMIIKDFECDWEKFKRQSKGSLGELPPNKQSEDKLSIKTYIENLSEKDHKDNFLQHLFREAGIFDSLFEFLNYDLEMGRCYNSEHNINLIIKIFHLLAEMTSNNVENKVLVTEKALKKIVIPYLMDEHNDFQVYFLIKELVKGNSALINNIEKMTSLINIVFKKISFYKYTDIRKSICLDILNYIILDHGEIHKHNQNLIIKKLFNRQDGNILPEQGFKLGIEYDSRKQPSLTETKVLQNQKSVEASNPMHYFCTLLKVLSACGDGKSAYAENIGQNYIKTSEIYEFLLVKNMNLDIKINIYNFYYHIYIDTEKLLASFKVTKTKHIWKFMIKEFIELSDDKSPLRLGICNNSFFRISGAVQGHVMLKEYLKILIKSILGLTKKTVFQTIPDTKLDLRKVSTAAKNLLKNYAELTQYLITFESEIENIMISSRGKATSGANFNELSENNEKSNSLDDPNGSKNDITLDPFYDSMNLPQSTKQDRLRKFLSKIAHSKDFKTICNKEFRQLSTKIQNIESVTDRFHSRIRFKDFAKSLISYLDPNNEEFDPELSSVSLMIFSKFIDSVNESTDKKSSEWDVSDFTECKRSLKRRQDSLIELRIVDYLCEIMKANTLEDLKIKSLELSISLLIGGNTTCQSVFHENMIKDQENLILLNMKRMLDESFDYIKKKMSEDNDREFKNKIQVSKKLTRKIQFGQKSREDLRLKHHIGICRKIYRFLQLLCEGHNIILQNFLRVQKKDSSSLTSNNINFISDTAFKFGSLIKLINKKNSDLISQILDFLIDSVQGPCLKNQKQLFRSKMTDFVKDMMNDMFFDVTKIKDLSELEGENEILNSVIKKGIKLVISLFEGNDGKKYAKYLATSIEFNILINKLSEELIRYYKNNYNLSLETMNTTTIDFLNKKLNCLTFDEDMSDAFDIFFFIKTLNSMTECYQRPIRELTATHIHHLAYQFFEQHSAHIEIVFQGNLQRVYFIIHPACNYLSDKKKDSILDEVKRDTANDKLTDLMKEAPRLFDLVDHLTNLANGFLGISPKMFEVIVDMSLLYAFVVNIIIFSLLQKVVKNNVSQIDESFDSDHIVMKICGIFYVVLGVLRLIVWILIEGKLVLLNRWREDFTDYKKYLHNNLDQEDEMDHVVLSYLSKNMIDITTKEKLAIIEHVNKKKGNIYVIDVIYYYTQSLVYLLGTVAFRYIIFYLTGSIYALASGDMIIPSFFLLEVVAKDPTLKDVIKAVTRNKRQLLLTAMLGFFIIYFYSLFAYYFINDTFFMDSVGDNGENICTTVVHCFTTVVSLGPRSSGGIGDVLLRQSYMKGNEGRYYIRFVYDVTCFIIINIIFMNIIFGIIIDTFAELRGAKNTKDYDKKNVCYICSLDRHKFENTSEGFEVHINRDHSVWNYIYFLYSVKKKDSTEFNGMETYVSNMIENDDVNWFPLYRAMSIKNTSDSKGNIEKQVEDMMDRVNKIKKKFQNE